MFPATRIPSAIPSPAIVAQSAVRRLPRWALWMLCSVYVLSGFIGRDPWRVDDAGAFALMQQWLAGAVAWGHPDLQTHHLLGAMSIKVLSMLSAGAIAESFSSRLPYMGMLALTLVCTWEATYYLAKRDAAQPVPFAFGGEARPNDYARALADGALLALIATLGLARLAHESSAALWQLCMVSLLFFAISTNRYHPMRALAALMVAVPALLLDYAHIAFKTSAVINVSTVTDLLHLMVWFAYPTWVLSAVSLYKWRRHWFCKHPSMHIALPLVFIFIHVLALLWVLRPERWLISALPPLACLAAFALPTLGRSLKSLIDFLSLLAASAGVVLIWLIWLSLYTGIPAQPALNVARLLQVRALPDFAPMLNIPLLLIGIAITFAWGKLVLWRLGRHQGAIWMSLVLPAAGWVTCWSLLMTILMPLLDHARRVVLP